MFKSYSSKKSAVKGAQRMGIASDTVYEKDGAWGFDVPDLATEVIDPSIATEEDKKNDPEGVNPDGSFSEAKEPSAAEAPAGRKIEKDRPKQNGVTRPSAGGMCRAVWDFCDEVNASGTLPTAQQVKQHATEQGWNVNNASIEYYQWRKFNGIRGRQSKPAEAPSAPAAE